jgi:hypothetical protein
MNDCTGATTIHFYSSTAQEFTQPDWLYLLNAFAPTTPPQHLYYSEKINREKGKI